MVVGSRTSCEPTRIESPPSRRRGDTWVFLVFDAKEKKAALHYPQRANPAHPGNLRGLPSGGGNHDAPVDGHAAGGRGQDRVEVELGDFRSEEHTSELQSP